MQNGLKVLRGQPYKMCSNVKGGYHTKGVENVKGGTMQNGLKVLRGQPYKMCSKC